MHDAANQLERLASGIWDREPLLPLGEFLRLNKFVFHKKKQLNMSAKKQHEVW